MLIKKNAERRHWTRSVSRHLMVWLGIGIIIFLSLLYLVDFKAAYQFVLILSVMAPAPVYLHFWIFDHYYTQRKYWKYVFFTVILAVFFGLIAQWLFNLLRQNPDEHISGILIVMFIIICSSGFKFYSRYLHQQYRIQETELRHVGTELALLKAQVNPHFFFNTLNNLYSLSLQQSEQVPEIIMKLSSLMRFVLDSSKTKFVPVQDEIEFISNFVSLEKLRLPDDYDLSFSHSVKADSKEIAPMVLTSIVENCFKHGLIDESSEAFIKISIIVNDNILILNAENRKSNDGNDTNPNESGFGLENMNRRLELLYPGRHELRIQDSKHNYSVTLRIRL